MYSRVQSRASANPMVPAAIEFTLTYPDGQVITYSYDAAGNLLPSDQSVAWLELPRGLTKLPVSSGTFHAYVAKGIPSDRLQAFFGARLIAGEVTKLGEQGIRLSRGIPPSGSKPKQSLRTKLDALLRHAPVASAVAAA